MKFTADTPLRKSRFIHTISSGDKAIIWHSLFGHPKIISKETLKLLNIFSEPKTLKSFSAEYETTQEIKNCLRELAKKYYLTAENVDERILLEEKIKKREQTITDGLLVDYLELIVSEECNFRCTPCIHFNNLQESERGEPIKKFMRFKVAKQAIDWYLAILRRHKKRTAEINFGGGEPLLAWPIIEQSLKYCGLKYGDEFTFRFSINTNASLITSETAAKLKTYKVDVASSLDGLREGNDKVRLTRSGKGTFNAVLKGFENLATAGYPIQGIAVTVSKYNFSYLNEQIIDWAAKQNMSEVRIDVDVIGAVEIPLKIIIDKLTYLRHYAKSYEIEVFGFWSRPIENLNKSALKTHTGFCGAARGNSVCINPSGDIYACGYSKTKLGALANSETFFTPKENYHKLVQSRFVGMMKMCKDCSIEGQCAGGCIITHEFARDASGAQKINNMCKFYRTMTLKLLREQLEKNL